MPKVNVTRSIHVDVPKEKVKEVLTDFKQWTQWSPWLITEPEAQVTYAEDGNQYAWDGKRIGAGEMRKGNMTNDHLSFDLTFLKPWKSTSITSFDLKETAKGTEVKWNMDSSLPFFMFWMKKLMEGWIGMDYERGLRMLKEKLETGTIQSKLEFQGETDYPGCTFVGIKRTVPMDQIDIAMEKDFSELITATAKADNIAGDMFSQYHKWQIVKRSVTYTAGVAVKEIPADLPDHWMVGNLPAGKLHVVRHMAPINT